MSTVMSRLQTGGTDAARHNANQEELTIATVIEFGPAPGGGAYLSAVPPGLNDMEIVRVTLGPVPNAAVGNPDRATATLTPSGAAPVWFLEYAAGQAFELNGGVQPLQDATEATPVGPLLPTPQITLAGAALAAFTAPIVGEQVPATIVYRPRHTLGRVAAGGTPDVWAWTQGVTFRDTAVTNRAAHLRAVEAAMFGGRAVVDLSAGVRLHACGFAAVDRRGVVWVQPGDLGNGPGQIPPALAANTAAAFNNHPAAFWVAGKAGNARSVGEVYENTRPIDDTFGAPAVFLVSDPVGASRWLFVHDNTPITGIVLHPMGSDLRRPRDVWNSVIVPAIASSQVGGGLVLYDGPPQLPEPRIVLGDLARLTYAHFLEPVGRTMNDPYTVVVQT